MLKITSDLHLSPKGGTFELHNKYTDSLARAEVSFKEMKPGNFCLVFFISSFQLFHSLILSPDHIIQQLTYRLRFHSLIQLAQFS